MNIRCFQRNFSAAAAPLSPIQLPSRMEAHIWYILPDEVKYDGLLNQYLELLSPCEKDNILRMHGDKLKKSALLARALVRTTIARYQTNSEVDPRSLRFRKNIHGKPEVEWHNDSDWHRQPLHFNISHTSSLIACGLTTISPIGVDVEEKQRRIKNNILAFASRYFSPDEVKVLNAISDPECQRQEFLKMWTLKEAYVKALGRGFSGAPFKTFTIQFGGATKDAGCYTSEVSEITVKPTDDSENLTSDWHFALLELAGSHYAAVCMEKDKAIEDMNLIDKGSRAMRLSVWRTIPFVEDELVSGTDAVLAISGLIDQL